jgi:hypothetical protein
MAVTVGADGFSYTRKAAESAAGEGAAGDKTAEQTTVGFKLGAQL